jgi:hypothetical protein
MKKLPVIATAAGLALGAGHAGATEPYVPWVTDFPKRESSTQFVPFVTDFGLEARPPGRTVVIGPIRPETPAPARPAPAAPRAGPSLGTLSLGAVLGVTFSALAALGLAGLRRGRGAPPPAAAGGAR